MHAQEHVHGLVVAVLLHDGDKQDDVPRRAAVYIQQTRMEIQV